MTELNQVQDSITNDATPNEEGELFIDTDNEGLFDDYTEEETPTESVESETIEKTDSTESPFGLKIKYNGEEMNLNEEEARTLAQKGMNYDRFYEPIERLARMNGMTVGDYLNRLNDTQIQYEVSKEVQNLRENPKYDGVSDEVLEEIANSHVMENINLQDRNFEEQIRGEADAQQAKVQRDIDLFMEEYPEFKDKGPDALDPKVYDYVRKGYTLLEAYNKWSREQVNPQQLAKQKSAKLNEENKKRSLGNTTNAGKVEADDFLNGFLNG